MKIPNRTALAIGAFIMTLLVLLIGIKALQIRTLAQPPPPFPDTIVTSAEVLPMEWEVTERAVGTIAPVRGIMVSAEVGGQIERLAFESGDYVKEGDLLVQLNIETELAQLRAAEATFELAKREVLRVRELASRNSISTAEVDNAEAAEKKAGAEVDQIRSLINKKSIRAPFDGKLGIRLVSVGQVIPPGEPLVPLESLSPVFIDFSLPQRDVAAITVGLKLRVMVDAFADRVFEGRLTAINPSVDDRSRSLQMQGLLPNEDEALRPGMFATVEVVTDRKESVLAIPATAVLYSPFGNSVFRIVTGPNGAQILEQKNVRVLGARGDFVAVTGIEAGDMVVSTGVFKLSNGLAVSVDNRLAPEAQLVPQPADS
ncbi:MAG: efflux RND transporter periplasmic adaptor subunit [Verrucomicrobiia bacterium]